MVIRWTAEQDQLLLVKIIETQNLSVNCDAIANAWPKDGAVPTARAIKERIFKLRQQNGGKGSSGGGSITTSTAATKVPSTPRKPKAKPSTTSASKSGKKNTPASRKRKNQTEVDEGSEVEDDEETSFETPKKRREVAKEAKELEHKVSAVEISPRSTPKTTRPSTTSASANASPTPFTGAFDPFMGASFSGQRFRTGLTPTDPAVRARMGIRDDIPADAQQIAPFMAMGPPQGTGGRPARGASANTKEKMVKKEESDDDPVADDASSDFEVEDSLA